MAVVPQHIWVFVLHFELDSTVKGSMFYFGAALITFMLGTQLTIRHKYSMSLGILSRKTLLAISMGLISTNLVLVTTFSVLHNQGRILGATYPKLSGAGLLSQQFISGTHLAFTIRHMASTNQTNALALLRNPRYFVRLLHMMHTHVYQVLFCRAIRYRLCRCAAHLFRSGIE
jgi:hypothetical protein